MTPPSLAPLRINQRLVNFKTSEERPRRGCLGQEQPCDERPSDEVSEPVQAGSRSARTARAATGAGIGLFVTKQLVEARGGQAWAVARPGGGSEFGLRLRPYTEDL